MNVICSGVNLKPLIHASQNYQAVLAENKKMFNEVQELKGIIIHVFFLPFVYYVSVIWIHTLFYDTGNIRVFCRIRPFLIDKKEKQSIVEDIGESDLVVVNPSKEGKDVHRSFKFNKIFGPAATQGLFIYSIPFLRLGYGEVFLISRDENFASLFLCIDITVFP